MNFCNKEKIIVASGINENELSRTLSKYDMPSIGLRVLSPLNLARMALVKAGYSFTEQYISKYEEALIVYSFLKQIDYFENAAFSDARNLSRTFTTLRMFVEYSDNEASIVQALNNCEFQEKNNAIIDAFKKYKEYLRKHNLIDGIEIIHRALKYAKPFDAEFYCLNENPLKPLENKLLSFLSSQQYVKTNLSDFANLRTKEHALPKYFSAYGSINEAESILSYIYENKIPLDQCLVCCSNYSEYSQIFFELSQLYGIQISFAKGFGIFNSYPIVVLRLLYQREQAQNNGIVASYNLLNSVCFNKEALSQAMHWESDLADYDIKNLAAVIGSLRISFDANSNKEKLNNYILLLQEKLKQVQKNANKQENNSLQQTYKYAQLAVVFAHELEMGLSSFIKKFSIVRTGKFKAVDEAAIKAICDVIEAFENYGIDFDFETILKEVAKIYLKPQISEEGHLHVCDINQGFACMRKYVFVCGMQANNFPGSVKEDYLLLDNDILHFSDSCLAPTSNNKIQSKIDTFYDFVNFSKNAGSIVSLSYSNYDLAELKEQNASSVLFGLFEQDKPGAKIEDFQNQVLSTNYFDAKLSQTFKLDREVANNAHFDFETWFQKPPKQDNLLERFWSPSALELFFACPRHFYLTKILQLEEPEEDDPSQVIPASDLGSMAHFMMQVMAENQYSKREFLDICSRTFDDFLITRPPVYEDDAKREKRNFVHMMEMAYDVDPHNEVLAAEEKLCYKHPCGVKLAGYPDRIEKDEDGNIGVVDFKTKWRVEHKENDIGTCLQVVIYAWLCNQAGICVTNCTYRYLRKSFSVNCQYDNFMQQQLDEKLNEFMQALKEDDFPAKPSLDNCKYCGLTNLCAGLIIASEVGGQNA